MDSVKSAKSVHASKLLILLENLLSFFGTAYFYVLNEKIGEGLRNHKRCFNESQCYQLSYH